MGMAPRPGSATTCPVRFSKSLPASGAVTSPKMRASEGIRGVNYLSSDLTCL